METIEQTMGGARRNARGKVDGSGLAPAAVFEPTEEELAIDSRTPDDIERERIDSLLSALGDRLIRDRADYISARAQLQIDKDWQEDLDMYNGRDPANQRSARMMDSVEQGFPIVSNAAANGNAKPTRSKVFINITRNKTNSGEGRLADILLPTDDRNWGIRPTPVPRLAGPLKDNKLVDPMQAQGMVAQMMPQGMVPPEPPQAGPDGAPLQVRDIAAAVMSQAKRAADSMQTLIEDQLTECDYNGEQRKVIHWAAVLGTGVLKGPVVTNRYRNAWMPVIDQATQQAVPGLWMRKFEEERVPASFAVDPRNCYPDPAAGEDPKRGSGHFERADETDRSVRKLASEPGYMPDRIAEVLRQGPMPSAVYQNMTEEQLLQYRKVYERWEYWGNVKLSELRACGCPGLPEDESDADELNVMMACVVMINDTVVKAYLHPQDGGEIPYDYFVWDRLVDTPWGRGVPRQMNSQQRVINAAWRQMMDNAGLGVGPQIIVNKLAVEPADGKWEITGRKIWWAKQEVEDVEKAMQVFSIEANQSQFQAIIEMAQNLIDEDTGLPRLVAGERGNAPETVGGMQMLLNSANVVLRRQVKAYDDSVTRPHITRYYDYNMEHSDDPAVKGDMSVDARGSGALIVRDIQNQFLAQVLAAYPGSPMLQATVRPRELIKKVFQSNYVDTETVLYSDVEIEQNMERQAKAAAEQKDPRIATAEIRAQSDVERNRAVVQSELSEIAMRDKIAEANHAYNMARLELDRDNKILDLALKKEMSVEQIRAQLASTALKERGANERQAAETALKLNPANPTHQGI